MAYVKKTEEEEVEEIRKSAAVDFPPTDPRYGPDGRLGFLLKLSAAIEKRVEFESGWIGQRMTWLVISQSFLFGAFAQAASHGDNELLILLKWLIVFIACSKLLSHTFLSRLPGGLVPICWSCGVGLMLQSVQSRGWTLGLSWVRPALD